MGTWERGKAFFPLAHYPFGFASRLRRETLPFSLDSPLPITHYPLPTPHSSLPIL
ncbi:hypothetical protein [Tolypothrix sp. VBCCA 56010]|uniref:hypothetical protein n=1 Tax=Tolypothrix sp. VBCCA 56010 TaxID=3137731 RepID=UPI003D7E0476